MLLRLIRIICLISTGLYAGIICGDRLGVSYSRRILEDSSFVLFQQTQHVHFKPVLMPLSILMLAAGLAWILLARNQWRRPEFWPVIAASVLIIIAFLETRLVNFPINDALMGWQAYAPPRDLRSIWSSWEHAHTVRAIASLSAFVLQAIAANLPAE